MSNIDRDGTSDRLRDVRAGFVQQGTSLSAWCRANGLTRQNVCSALQGERRGPKAEEVVRRAVAAATGQHE